MSVKATGIESLHCEILDLIFDELQLLFDDEQDMKETISACRLVCRWLNDFASPFLFRTLGLTQYSPYAPRVQECDFAYGVPVNYKEYGEERSQEVLSLLEANPKIAPLVRSLSIDTYAYKNRASHWIRKSETLLCILERLVNVKHFTFRAHCGRLKWTYFEEPLTKSLEALLHRPFIHRLAFRDIEALPLRVILTSSSLCHLSITDGTHGYDGGINVNSDTRSPPSLEVSPRALTCYSSTWCDDASFTHSGYMSRVTFLKLKLDYVHSGDLHAYDADKWNEPWCNLLKNLPQLKELEVGVSSEGQWAPASTWPSADGLLSLKSLETLRIKVSIAFTNEYNYYIPQIITTALKAQRPMRSVTTIHITVMAFYDDTMERITRGWNNVLNLDEWLQRTYPMLKKVVLEFVLGNNSVRDDESDEGWSPALVNFSRGAMKEMAENFWPALVESSSVIKIITPTAVFEL
ncbi:hypothetical protein BJ165DRAFT_1404630 [Panaeolus papilionaceus]|nr:hypothetical protein BJ165DRAFT_1404630 [Panaeolus papilionaceus]